MFQSTSHAAVNQEREKATSCIQQGTFHTSGHQISGMNGLDHIRIARAKNVLHIT